MGKSVLIITTSHTKLGDTGKATGSWAEEIIAPWKVWTDAGYDVTIASMSGGEVPIDANSMADGARTPDVDAFYADPSLKQLLLESKALADVNVTDYDAVFLPGGHGVVYDMPDDPALQKAVAASYDAGKIVSAVCHGPAGLVNVKLANGSYLFAGKKVTGFSNTEEAAVGLTEVVPFLTEDKMKERGGEYSKKDDWAVYAITDGRLITGQNPGSSKAVAEAVVAALK